MERVTVCIIHCAKYRQEKKSREVDISNVHMRGCVAEGKHWCHLLLQLLWQVLIFYLLVE